MNLPQFLMLTLLVSTTILYLIVKAAFSYWKYRGILHAKPTISGFTDDNNDEDARKASRTCVQLVVFNRCHKVFESDSFINFQVKYSTYYTYGGVTAAALVAQNAKQDQSVQIENEDDDNSGDDVEEVATRNEIDTVADEEEEHLSLELNWTITERTTETTKEAIKDLSHSALEFVIRLYTNYGKSKPSPCLDLIRAIVKVFSVDKVLAEETNELCRNMLRLIGIGEFSDLAEWKYPYQSYTIAEVICNHCRDVELCKDKHRAIKDVANSLDSLKIFHNSI
uniref:DNA polymerase epsilon catalytic subunit n=1 Tax=Glossina pallidipes TaxID=7398 RepID=A0A1B0AH46_GLOPL